MKKLKLFLIVGILAIVGASCSQSELGDVEKGSSNIGKESMTFTYKGAVYSSTYQIVDSKRIWDNANTGELYESLQKQPKLVTFVKKDGSIELLDNVDNLLNDESATKVSTKAETGLTISGFELYCYSQSFFRDRENKISDSSISTIYNLCQSVVEKYCSI